MSIYLPLPITESMSRDTALRTHRDVLHLLAAEPPHGAAQGFFRREGVLLTSATAIRRPLVFAGRLPDICCDVLEVPKQYKQPTNPIALNLYRTTSI